MIATKSLIGDIKDVPITWAFEFYLNLPQQLYGQDLMVKSPFNLKERTPSCNVYWHHKLDRYQFKDHSSGEGGSCQDLVRKLYNMTPTQAMFRMIEDYNRFILDNKGDYNIVDFKEQSKYKLKDHTKRLWNKLDEKFWYTQYGIGSDLLEQYKVSPLESYKLEKDSGEHKELTISGPNIYGYFRADGILYKIYQPKQKDYKFIKVRDYIQGTDQLTYTKPTLIITSSLKDMMCLMNYKWNLESVAPNSENTLIPDHIIQAYKHKYKNIFTLLDNDSSGIKAMKKYEEKYNIPFIHIEGAKDISDNIVQYGLDIIETILYNKINIKLKENEILHRN